MEDISVTKCVEFLLLLDPMPPVTKELDKWGSKYPSQKVHMCRWLVWQKHTYSGKYGRATPNHSTKVTYNRFQNPGGLLWMAEVLGEDETTLRAAVAAAVEAEKKAAKYDGKSRCKAFREVIPWERIGELLEHPENWKTDPAMDYLTEYRKRRRYPVRKAGYMSEFKRELWREGLAEEAVITPGKATEEQDG